MQRKHSKTAAALAAAGMAFAGGAWATSFFDDFNASTLDAGWGVYEYTGARSSYDSSPANHYSLTDRPGYLRYYLDPMTNGSGYANNYQTVSGYDPGLEIYRSIVGDQWSLETKIDFHMPAWANGRTFNTLVWFGDQGQGPSAPWSGVLYYRDSGYNSNRLYLSATDGNETLVMNPAGPDDWSLWTRMVRDGGLVDVFYSFDGQNWTLGAHEDRGGVLDGLDQRLSLSASAWWVPGGSYADYDYVKFTSRNGPEPIPAPATLLLTLLGLGGLGLARRRG